MKIGLAVLAVAGGLSTAGCADFARVTSITPVPLATNSAVAAQVRAATKAHYPLPRFRDVPPKPKDVPTPASYRAAVAEIQQSHNRLETWIAANPPMQPLDVNRTEAFAAGQRARIPAGEMTPPVLAGSEEYAARLREFATPPPPPR